MPYNPIADYRPAKPSGPPSRKNQPATPSVRDASVGALRQVRRNAEPQWSIRDMQRALEAANIGTDKEPYNPITQHVDVSGYDIGASNYMSSPTTGSSGYGGFLSGLGGIVMLGLTAAGKFLSASSTVAHVALDSFQSNISATRQIINNLNWRSKSNWWDNNAKPISYSDSSEPLSQYWDDMNLLGGVRVPTPFGELDIGAMIGQDTAEFYTFGRLLHDEDWLQDYGSLVQFTLPVNKVGGLFGKEWEDWHWDVTPSFLAAAPLDLALDPLVWMTGGLSKLATPVRALVKTGAAQTLGAKLTRKVIEEAVEKTIRNRIGAAVGMSASDAAAAAMSGTAIKSHMDEIVTRVMAQAEEAAKIVPQSSGLRAGKAAKSAKHREAGLGEMADRVDEVIAKELEDLFQTLGGSYGVQVATGRGGLGENLADLFEVGIVGASSTKGVSAVGTAQARRVAKIWKKLNLNAAGQTADEFAAAAVGTGKRLIGKESQKFIPLFDDAAVTSVRSRLTQGGRNAHLDTIDDMSLSLGFRVPFSGSIGRATARRLPVLKNAEWAHSGRPIGISVLGGSKVARDAAVLGVPRSLRYLFSDVAAGLGTRVTRGKMRGRFGSQVLGTSKVAAKARLDEWIAKGASPAKAKRIQVQALKDMVNDPLLDAGLRLGAKNTILDMQRGNSMMHRARNIFIRKSASRGEGFRQKALDYFGGRATPAQIKTYGEAIPDAAEQLGARLKGGEVFVPEGAAERMIPTSNGIDISEETAMEALNWFKEVRIEAHAMAGMDFIPEREFYMFRMVGDDAQEYMQFKQNFDGLDHAQRSKWDPSDIEKARRYGSPDEVAAQGGKGTMSDNFLGEQLYNPSPPDGIPAIPEQINEIMIRHFGEGWDELPQMYNRDIFDMMNRYAEIVSRRVGEVHTEVLMRADRVLTDKWITQLHIPSDAIHKAALVVRQRQIALDQSRIKLLDKMRSHLSSTPAERKLEWAAVENQAKVYNYLQNELDNARNAQAAKQRVVEAQRVKFEISEGRVKQLEADVATIQKEIDDALSMSAEAKGAAAKKEFDRLTVLEKERQDLLDEVKRLELGGPDDVAVLNSSTVYGALWEEARSAVATKVWLERALVEAFGDVDTAKAFAAWYAKEWDATAKRLGPQAVTGESGLEATNKAVADAMQDSIFTHQRAQGSPFAMQARDGRLFFEHLSHQFDNNHLGEWVAMADPERFMMPVTPTGRYAGASHAVFEALDFLDTEVTRIVRRLEELTVKYTTEVPELSANLAARKPPRATMTEKGQAAWAEEEIARLEGTHPSLYTAEMKAEVAELRGYVKYLEAPETPAVIDRFAIPTPEALEDAKRVIVEAFESSDAVAAISSKEFDDAARMHLALVGDKPVLRVNDVGDVDALISAAKGSFAARARAKGVEIADSPLGDVRFKIGDSLTDETGEIGLSAYVLLQRFRAQVTRGIRDGALPRTAPVNIESLVAAVDDLTDFVYRSEVAFNGKRYLMTEYHDFGEMAAETAADAVYRELNIPVRNSWGDVSSDGRMWRVQEIDELENIVAIDPNVDLMNSKIIYGEDASAQIVSMDSKVGAGQTGVNSASRFEQGFAADILLGHQDVMGLDLRHLGLTSDGRITRLSVEKTFGNWADPPILGPRIGQQRVVSLNVRRMTDAELGAYSDEVAEKLSTRSYLQDAMDETLARGEDELRAGLFNHPLWMERRMHLEQDLIYANDEMAYRGLKWEGDHGWVRRDKTYDLETWAEREVARQGVPPTDRITEVGYGEFGDDATFREFFEYTERTGAAEKSAIDEPFSAEATALSRADPYDWEAFSRARGYTEEEISDFRRYLETEKKVRAAHPDDPDFTAAVARDIEQTPSTSPVAAFEAGHRRAQQIEGPLTADDVLDIQALVTGRRGAYGQTLAEMQSEADALAAFLGNREYMFFDYTDTLLMEGTDFHHSFSELRKTFYNKNDPAKSYRPQHDHAMSAKLRDEAEEFLSQLEEKIAYAQNTGGSTADRGFRTTEVQIQGGADVPSLAPPPAAEVPRLMEGLMASGLHADDPQVFIREFLKIHPFADGNGRTAAILLNHLSPAESGYKLLPDYFGTGFVGEPPTPIGPWGQRVTDASLQGGYVERVGTARQHGSLANPVEITIRPLPQNLAEDFLGMGNLPPHQRVEILWDYLGAPPSAMGERTAGARAGLKRMAEITDEMSAEGILVTASVDEDATALRNLYAKAGFKEITHYDDSGMIFIAKFPEPVQIPHVLDDFAKLEGKGIEGVGKGEQFRRGVDNILAVRAKYGGWREMLAHALPVGAQSDEQIRRLALFLETRTEQLAAIADRPYLVGKELLGQQQMQAAGAKSEWNLIRSESRGHGISVEPTLDPMQVSGRVGAAARGTDQAHFLEEGTQVLPWIDGSGINMTPQTMAYGGENAFERSDFIRMVIDLNADASNIKLYGFQPADPNLVRARQLLVKLGDDNMTAETLVETLDQLTDLMPRPYGKVSPYKQVSREGRLASGIGEQTLDMLDRGGDDLLDELLRFANPKQRKTITLVREGGEVVEEILDSAATTRTINAFNRVRAIMSNPALAEKFPAYSLSQQRGLMREVLEFVSWQENRYARRLVDDEGLGSLSDAIDRYFVHRNKDLNPNGYAEAVASAEAGAAAHANELIGTVHLRYMQNQELRAGMKWDEWLELNGSITNTAAVRKAVARAGSFDPVMMRPFLARYPESSLIGRLWQQYHLSLAGDGYSATAWMNATDRWTISPFIKDTENIVGRRSARPATVADDPLDEAGMWLEEQGMAGAWAEDSVLSEVQQAQNEFSVNVTLTNPLGVRPRIFMDDMERTMAPDDFANTLANPIEQNLVDPTAFEKTYRQAAIDALVEDNGIGELSRRRVVADDALEKAVEKQKIVTDNLWLMERDWNAHLETVNRLSREVDSAKELLQLHEWAIERRNLFAKAMAKLQTLDPEFKFKQGGVNALSEAYQDLESTIRLLGMADLEESKFILQTLAEGGSFQGALDELLDVSSNVAKLRNMPEAVPMMDRAWRAGWRPIGVKSQGREALVESIVAADMYHARGGMGKFLGRGGYYDAVHNVWKGYAILSPGFWARNYMGGMFLNYLHGVDISSYTRFMRAYNALKIEQAVAQGKIRRAEGRKLLDKATGGKVSADDISIVRQMEETGAFGQGQAGVEFTPSTGGRGVITVAGKRIDLNKFNPFSSRNVALKAGHSMNIKVETFLRGSIGFDTMKKGGTLGQAMDDIWKYHFDYDDLSRFERGVVKKIVPFYTWTRKSLPLIAEQFMMKPYKFNRYRMAVDAISEDDWSDFGVVPDWMVRQGAVPLGHKFAGEHMWMIPDLPMRGFYELVNTPTRADMSPIERIGAVGEALSSMVTPLIKAPVELLTNRNIWKGYSFNGSLEPVPEAFSWVPGLMPALDAMGAAQKTPKGNWVMKDNWLHSMTQLVPTLSQARRLFPDEERYQHRLLSSWMSFMFGLGLRTNTSWEQQQELRARYYEQMDKDREMRDIYKADMGIR